jgi:hypothetical protein
MKVDSPLFGLLQKQIEILFGGRERRVVETVFFPIAINRVGPLD